MNNDNYMKPMMVFKKGDENFPKTLAELSRLISQEDRKQKITKLGWRG